MAKIVLGYENEDSADIHHARVVRNPKMDIYQNYTEARFTPAEFHYFQIAKALQSGETVELLPPKEEQSDHVVPHVSQAEIYHMKKMSKLGKLASQVGFYAVKIDIEAEDVAYRDGLLMNSQV